jgi:hypothetical protein
MSAKRPPSRTLSHDIGDVLIAQPRDSGSARLVMVIGEEGHEQLVRVALCDVDDLHASPDDVVLRRSETGLAFTLLIHLDLPTRLPSAQLGKLILRLPDEGRAIASAANGEGETHWLTAHKGLPASTYADVATYHLREVQQLAALGNAAVEVGPRAQVEALWSTADLARDWRAAIELVQEPSTFAWQAIRVPS